MTSTPTLDAIRPYTTGDCAMDERTELELKHVFERIKNGPRGKFAVKYRTDAEQRTANEWRDDPVKLLRQEADRLAKAVAEAEVAQDQDRACEIALAALSR
jgi:hypothetical protein